ncbi:hypothetical protein, partial [Paraglaciecola sp.]|uniref:hypothetical protein n=1 Tax=Paraglaciecola sp. TaxID=1920173 RepID=UPI00273FECE8
ARLYITHHPLIYATLGGCLIFRAIFAYPTECQIMSKERSSKKESKKQPALSPKEKKAAKQEKKTTKNMFDL